MNVGRGRKFAWRAGGCQGRGSLRRLVRAGRGTRRRRDPAVATARVAPKSAGSGWRGGGEGEMAPAQDPGRARAKRARRGIQGPASAMRRPHSRPPLRALPGAGQRCATRARMARAAAACSGIPRRSPFPTQSPAGSSIPGQQECAPPGRQDCKAAVRQGPAVAARAPACGARRAPFPAARLAGRPQRNLKAAGGAGCNEDGARLQVRCCINLAPAPAHALATGVNGGARLGGPHGLSCTCACPCHRRQRRGFAARYCQAKAQKAPLCTHGAIGVWSATCAAGSSPSRQ